MVMLLVAECTPVGERSIAVVKIIVPDPSSPDPEPEASMSARYNILTQNVSDYAILKGWVCICCLASTSHHRNFPSRFSLGGIWRLYLDEKGHFLNERFGTAVTWFYKVNMMERGQRSLQVHKCQCQLCLSRLVTKLCLVIYWLVMAQGPSWHILHKHFHTNSRWVPLAN